MNHVVLSSQTVGEELGAADPLGTTDALGAKRSVGVNELLGGSLASSDGMSLGKELGITDGE